MPDNKTNNTKLRQIAENEASEVIGGLDTVKTQYVTPILDDDDYVNQSKYNLSGVSYKRAKITEEDFDENGKTEFKIDI